MRMFMGEYSHSLDAKGRLIIPAKFREKLGETFVITRSLDKCLCIYDSDEWEKFAAKLEELPYNAAKQRKLTRYFLSGAAEAETDKQGRVLIPQNLRNAAGIDRDVVLVGAGRMIEIWSRELWEENITDEEIDQIAEEMLTDGFRI